MGQFAMSKRNLLILLGLVIPTVCNSKTHRFPNELFHEEFEFQRTRAIHQPSAIDRRDAIRLDTRDSTSASADKTLLVQTSPRPYRDQTSTVSGLRRHRTTQEPKAASKFRKRVSHQGFDEKSVDRSVLRDGQRRRRGFNGASVEIKPEDQTYEFERIKKKRNEKKSKIYFDKKRRMKSKYALMKRSGEIVSDDISEESANNNPSEELLPLKNVSDQGNTEFEKIKQNKDKKDYQRLLQSGNYENIQRTNETKVKEVYEAPLLEQNKKRRRKVLRVRNRNKNDATDADGLKINATFERIQKKEGKPRNSPVFYENKAVRASYSNGNRTDYKSRTRIKKPKIINKDIAISSNKTSQSVWKESPDYPKTSFHNFDEDFSDKGESFKGGKFESGVLRNKPADGIEKENISVTRNQNNRKSKSKKLDTEKASPKKTPERVWKEINYSETPSHEIIEKERDEHKFPKDKSQYRIPENQTNNKTSEHLIKNEEYLRWPMDILDTKTTNEPLPKETLNSDKKKAKTVSRVKNKQPSKHMHLQDGDSKSSFINNEEETFYKHEDEMEISKPEWMFQNRPENVTNSDGNYLLSFNFKGDSKDQPKDVIKLHEEVIPKKLLKKAQEIPDKKVTSTKSKKLHVNNSKKELAAEKTPQIDYFEFSKRFKNQDNEDEQDQEYIREKNYENGYSTFKSNPAQVSFKKKSKKQPVEAVWKPAKPEEKSKNEELRSSRSKSRSNIWNDGGHFTVNDDESPYPNPKEYNFDKFPATKIREKTRISIEKDPVVKVNDESPYPNPKEYNFDKFQATKIREKSRISIEKDPVVKVNDESPYPNPKEYNFDKFPATKIREKSRISIEKNPVVKVNDESPYPNPKEYNFDKFPTPKIREKSRISIEKDPVVKVNNESPHPNPKEYNFDKFPATEIREKSRLSIEKDPVVKDKIPYVKSTKIQQNTSPNEDRKYFMTMFKRMGDISLEDMDSEGGKTAKNDGYVSSIKLSWNDDDTRAHIDASLDSRRQPFFYDRHSNEYFTDKQSEFFSKRTTALVRDRNKKNPTHRNDPPELMTTDISSSKSKEAIPRQKRSTTSEEKEHFFRSHFTLGKGGPSHFLTSRSSAELFGVPSEQKEIKKESAVRSKIANTPTRHKTPSLNKQLPNSEVISYYNKPQDSKGIEQLTTDFNSKKLEFPFDSNQKPPLIKENMKSVQSFQTHKTTPNLKPKPTLVYNNIKERRNSVVFPQARNIQTIKHTNSNSSKPFFYHSFSSVPSEPKVYKSSFKLKPSFERQKNENTHLLNVRNGERTNKTDEASTGSRQSKLQGRHISQNTKLYRKNVPSGISSPNHKYSNKNIKPQKESKNIDNARPTTYSKKFNTDFKREAETQLHISKDYPDPENHQYSRSFNSAHDNPRSAKTSFSFEKDTWEDEYETPEHKSNDHPNYHTIPETHFKCRGAGYYADPEAGCQVFHMCQESGEKHSFLCPNNTLFNQLLLVCDWHNKVNCDNAESQYNVNERIYSSEIKDKDNNEESPKWNTQHVWSYSNEYPKSNHISSRNANNKKIEPESGFSYNSAFSKRKEFEEGSEKSTVKPSLQESKNPAPTTKPLFETTTRSYQTGELSFRNSKGKSPVGNLKTTIKPSYRGSYKYSTKKPAYVSYDDYKTTIKPAHRISENPKTTIKPVYHTTMRPQTTTDNDNLQENYFNPKEYDYFKEHEYSVIHDIVKPQSKSPSISHDKEKTHNKDHSVNLGISNTHDNSRNYDYAKPRSRDHSVIHDITQTQSKDNLENHGIEKSHNKGHSVYHNTAKTQNKDHSVNYANKYNKDHSVNRDFVKPPSKSHHSVIYDIEKSTDQSIVPETTTHPETNEERSNWEPSKLKQSVEPELRSTADSVRKFKEKEKSASRDGVKKSTVRPHSTSISKETSHMTFKKSTTTEPRTERTPSRNGDQWSQERKGKLPTTFRNAGIKNNSTKNITSNHAKPLFAKQLVENEKPIPQVRNFTSAFFIQKDPPRFDDNIPKERKFQNSKSAEVKTGGRKYQARTLPQTDQSSKNGTKYRMEISKFKSNLPNLNTNVKLENPKDSAYKYPLPTSTRIAGSSKDTLFGDRIENARNVSEKYEHNSKIKQEKPKRNADSRKKFQVTKNVKPSINITSRIKDIMSGIETIGTDVSKILDGKDYLYKNIQVHKMKPTNTHNGKVRMSLETSNPAKNLNFSSNSKRTDKGKSKTKTEGKRLPKVEIRPKPEEISPKAHVIFEMYPRIHKTRNSTDYPNWQTEISQTAKFESQVNSKQNSAKKDSSIGDVQINKEVPYTEFSNFKKIDQLSLLNETNSKPIELEKTRKNVSESFQYFDFNPNVQPIESHLLHQPFEVETASESRESFREIRHVPQSLKPFETSKPRGGTTESTQVHTKPKTNIDRFSLFKKQSQLDNDHVIIPKNIFQAVWEEESIPLMSLNPYPSMAKSSTSTHARFSGPGLPLSMPDAITTTQTLDSEYKEIPNSKPADINLPTPTMNLPQDKRQKLNPTVRDFNAPANVNLPTPTMNLLQDKHQKLNPTVRDFNAPANVNLPTPTMNLPQDKHQKLNPTVRDFNAPANANLPTPTMNLSQDKRQNLNPTVRDFNAPANANLPTPTMNLPQDKRQNLNPTVRDFNAPANANWPTPTVNLSQDKRQQLNPTVRNFNGNNKTERFLPGSRNTHSYINLPRKIVKSNSNFERQQTHRESEYKNPSPKQKLPAFIFTINPFSERPLLRTTKKAEQKPYILVNRPMTRPASNLQYTRNHNHQESIEEQSTHPNLDNLEEDCDDSTESTFNNGDPGDLHLEQAGPQYLPSANDKPTLHLDGKSEMKLPNKDGLAKGSKCRKQGRANILQMEIPVSKNRESYGRVPITQIIPNRITMMDSYVTLPKVPQHQLLAGFEEGSPHSKSISKISDMLRERGQLPPKPVQLFEGHEFLRPVISSEFFPKNIRTPSSRTPSYQPKESQFSEESSMENSENSSEESIKAPDANRHYKYTDLEKAAEIKAEEIVKNSKPSS